MHLVGIESGLGVECHQQTKLGTASSIGEVPAYLETLDARNATPEASQVLSVLITVDLIHIVAESKPNHVLYSHGQGSTANSLADQSRLGGRRIDLPPV
jgi:hypothetical protein